METCGIMSALDRPAAELTVMDVYDIAAVLGHEFERIIDRFGCESLVRLVPKVVRVLEQLEALVSRGAAGQEAEELRRELERLRQERSDKSEQERRHQKELELVEDVWRGEVQDLLSQITRLQAENKRLLVSLSLKESPVTEEDLHKQEGMSEKERHGRKKLLDFVDKQRDEIRAKDHELTLRNEDVDALQMQQHRVIRINQDLRHRIGVMEAQGKALIQQRAELQAAAQARQQEVGALQLEVRRLRKELRDWELEREISEIEGSSLTKSGMSPPASLQMMPSEAAPPNIIKPKSVWVECGGDPGFMANCFEHDKSPSILRRSSNRENNEEEGDEDEEATALLLKVPADTELEEQSDSPEQESDKPRFTLQELRDVLQERNELKAQVFVLEEELAYYKSDDSEDDTSPFVCASPPPPCSNSTDQPESGIRRLIFTAIMPMVAAGLITDDPTLLPIRRLSFV
ncbi:RILP-like protein 1 [Paralichthys olivaceus]|uniref:RILP-like protein 1 n=1 Tax=Paralichthys olivaceus TaxID=8255 RepID=UPI00097DC379|nr:PREDICTED: RILP-like protein 1 [Paralichthys olivaceus]XP_019956386.1 PREDICTED: RILP-like protein 1 [Paralichthys olivaceus]